MSKSNSNWRQQQNQDIYVRKAKALGYRSRASFKLAELSDKYKLFKNGGLVIDLGAAPGGWSQFAAPKIAPKGRLVACDILPMKALKGVHFVQGNFMADVTRNEILQQLNRQKANLIMSDMAPNLSGDRIRDQASAMALVHQALQFTNYCLQPAGNFIVKLFQGEDMQQWLAEAKKQFTTVSLSKPKASKSGNREIYAIALGKLT